MVEVVERLKEINGLIAKKKAIVEVTCEDALKMESFFRDYENTNPLIDALERMAHHDLNGLYEYGDKLRGVVEDFMSHDLSVWKMVDFDLLLKGRTNNRRFSSFKITYLQLLVYALSRIANALSTDLEK